MSSSRALSRLCACALALAACDARVQVLDVEPVIEDAGEPDSSTIMLGCDVCAPLELCAIDECIDAAGTTFLRSGLRHVCAVNGGALSCWGDNGSGQLGLGDSNDRDAPSRVGNFDDWLYVAGGQQHTCAIRSPGTLYCWGENTVGQLGLGDADAHNKPARVPELRDVAEIACGGDGCCALRAAGALYCWGDNLEGNPGQNDAPGSADVFSPAVVSRGTRFSQVSVGAGHSCAIRRDGALFCWGRNTDGQLGIGGDEAPRRKPTRVGTASDWRTVSVAQHHSCGIRGDGELYCWGRNEFYELGIGSDSLDDATLYAKPVRVGRDADWSAVALGGFHTCALKRSGSLYCFGRSQEGQLGLGMPPDTGGGMGAPPSMTVAVPTQVDSPLRFRSVSAGSFHSCALDEARKLHCWGANTEGQLGLGDQTPRDAPTALSAP